MGENKLSGPSSPAFERLVKAGCDPAELHAVLAVSRAHHVRALDTPGLKAVELERLSRDLLDLSHRLRRVNEATETLRARLLGEYAFADLPDRLLECRAAVEAVRARRKGRPRVHQVVAEAQLHAYVQVKTGRPHLRELADLLDTTPEALREFRKRERPLIDRLCREGSLLAEGPPASGPSDR